MANSEDKDQDLFDLPAVPGEQGVPGSPGMEGIGPVGDDDEVLRKMGSKMGPVGYALGALIVIGVVGLVVFAVVRQQQYAGRMDAYEEIQRTATDEEDFLRRATALLGQTEFADVKMEIMERIGHYRYEAAVPALIGELRSPLPEVRGEAARALTAIGSPAADPARPTLLEVLPSSVPPARAPIVWALAVLQEPAAADAIIEEFESGGLQAQESFDPNIIATVLGLERLSSDILIQHRSEAVRVLTAQSLAELGSADIIDPLTRLVDHELQQDEPSEAVLRACAAGFGRAGDERAGRPLFDMVRRQPMMRPAVMDSLRNSVAAPGVAALLPAATDPHLREDLIRMIADSHDPRIADTLAGLLGDEDEDIHQRVVFGLADLGDERAQPALLEIARGEDRDQGRLALAELRELGASNVSTELEEMVGQEPYLSRNADLLRALGRSGDPSVGRTLMAELEGNDVTSASLALADLDYDPAFDVLLERLDRGDVDYTVMSIENETPYRLRTAAVKAMGFFGRIEAAEMLMTVIEDPLDDGRIRSDAGYALGAVADSELRRVILQKIRDPEVEDAARRCYVAALWQQPDSSLVPELLEVMGDGSVPTEIRIAAALAVGYGATEEHDDAIMRLLEGEDTREVAAMAVVLGGTAEHARALLRYLGENEELARVLREQITAQGSQRFELMTGQMFESGSIFRRIEVAQILRDGEEGNEDNAHGVAWNKLMERFRAGFEGHDGLTVRAIRENLWEALRGDDPRRRRLAVAAFRGLDERGLLMAARDMGGNGAEEARDALLEMNRAPAGS
jgi:HEAT repeat protein